MKAFSKIACAAALFASMASAHANYVQYKIDDSNLKGTIIQDEYGDVKYFQLADTYDVFPIVAAPGGTMGTLVAESTHFLHGGPTNFTINNTYGGWADDYLTLDFAHHEQGYFSYTATLDINHFDRYGSYSRTYSGLITQERVTTTSDWLATYGIQDVIYPEYVGPNEVPEPTSIALVGLGIVGLVGASKRRA